MKLNEIRAAQSEEATPTLSDLLFALQGETPLGFTIEEIFSLLPPAAPSVLPMEYMMDDLAVTNDNHGQLLFTIGDAENTLTVGDDAEIGWYMWIFNGFTGSPADNLLIEYPADSLAPPTAAPGVWVLARGADDVSDPENPVKQFGLFKVRDPSEVGTQEVFTFDYTASFPAEGAADTLYITSTNGFIYRWNGSAYVRIGIKHDVQSYANFAAFPPVGYYTLGQEGDENTIYVARDTNRIYRYNGSNYVPLLQAAHVGDADDTSLATLAASIDDIRDALVAAGLMAAS